MLMKIPKPTEADRERFTGLVPDAPQVEIKPMFGNLGAFVDGNMFMGLFGSDIGVKLNPTDLDAVRAVGGTPFGPAERPMRGYVTVPVALPHDQREQWISAALAYVGEQPPKRPKPRS